MHKMFGSGCPPSWIPCLNDGFACYISIYAHGLLHHAHLPLRSQLHSCHDSDVCPSILFGMFRFKLVAPNLMPFAYSFRSMTVSSHIPCKTFMEYTYTYACTRVVIKLRCTHKQWCLDQLLFPVIATLSCDSL
jgi:hypothetical protein